MGRLKSVFEPLDKAADAVIAESRDPAIEKRREILDTLDDGLGFLANAMSVMTWERGNAARSNEAAGPIYDAVRAVLNAADTCRAARYALKDQAEAEAAQASAKP